MVLDTIKKTVALSLTNPLQSSDELIIRNVITNIGRKYNLRIVVLSKNRDVIDKFSPNSFDFPELNLNEAIKISDSNQQTVGYLYIERVGSSFSFGPMALVPMIIFILFIAFLMSSFKKVRLIYSDLSNISKDDYSMSDFTFEESYRHANDMKKVFERNLENQKYKFLYEYARDLAHNLRQPLAVLNTFIRKLPGDFNHDMRELVVGVTKDVDDIINNLLDKYGIVPKLETSDSKSSVLLISFLEKKVTQARTAYNELADITLEYPDEAYGLFAEVSPAEFGSVISNLINNSILAMDQGTKGDIRISLDVKEDRIQIAISDNGPGFPKEVLEKIGQKGNTTRKSGHGLGIPHAIRTIESHEGRINFGMNTNGTGATVRISLPRINPPSWFLERIELQKECKVIVVDDFQRIHQIWKERFSEKYAEYDFLSFYSCGQFYSWFKDNDLKNVKILVDYDFQTEGNGPSFKNGLEMIQSLGIERSSILVTSHYEDIGIQNQCSKIGLKLLPKPMIGYVPVHEVRTEPKFSKVKIVQIEDNRLVRKSWKLEALSHGVDLMSFSSGREALANIKDLDKIGAFFFVDVCLDGEDGLEVSENIKECGFENIYLSTGYTRNVEIVPDCVKGIIDKDFESAFQSIRNHF